jgi:hypothetical protein
MKNSTKKLKKLKKCKYVLELKKKWNVLELLLYITHCDRWDLRAEMAEKP